MRSLGLASIVLDGDRTIAQGHAAQSLVVERRAYDAFGKAIILPTGVLPSLFAVTDRGFTDHEHLLDVKLIHMNGRAFDYNLGRFLSVDPFITGAGDSQSANPYSYIGNNPMSGVDPTGYQRTHESDLDTAPPPNVDETQHTVAVRTNCEMTRGVGGSCDSAIPLSSTGSGGDTSKVNEHFSDVGKAGAQQGSDQGLSAGEALKVMGSVIADHWKGILRGAVQGARDHNPVADVLVDFAGAEEIVEGTISTSEGDYTRAAMSAGEASLAKFKVIRLFKGSKGAEQSGEFSIIDWKGYPDGPKPEGPFRILEGGEYQTARKAADSANRKLHRSDPSLKGKQLHEVKPVKFGGSPPDPSNKTPLTPNQHAEYTKYWNRLQRDLKK